MVTEIPAAVCEDDQKGHEEPDKEIRDSQREEEEVGGGVKLPGLKQEHHILCCFNSL